MKEIKCAESFGEYTNQIQIRTPEWWDSSHKFFGVDPCIAGEIVWLISKGVRTHESCCGHGKQKGYIAVDDNSASTMGMLGYKKLPHKDKIAIYEPRIKCVRWTGRIDWMNKHFNRGGKK